MATVPIQKTNRRRRSKNAGLPTDMKYCKGCDEVKPLEEFRCDKRRVDGRKYTCTTCLKEAERSAPRQRDRRAHGLPGRAGYVYLLKSEIGVYKIGRSKRPLERLGQIQCSIPLEIELLHTVKCADYLSAEAVLHKRYAAKRVKGEWFQLNDEDVAAIRQINAL